MCATRYRLRQGYTQTFSLGVAMLKRLSMRAVAPIVAIQLATCVLATAAPANASPINAKRAGLSMLYSDQYSFTTDTGQTYGVIHRSDTILTGPLALPSGNYVMNIDVGGYGCYPAPQNCEQVVTVPVTGTASKLGTKIAAELQAPRSVTGTCDVPTVAPLNSWLRCSLSVSGGGSGYVEFTIPVSGVGLGGLGVYCVPSDPVCLLDVGSLEPLPYTGIYYQT